MAPEAGLGEEDFTCANEGFHSDGALHVLSDGLNLIHTTSCYSRKGIYTEAILNLFKAPWCLQKGDVEPAVPVLDLIISPQLEVLYASFSLHPLLYRSIRRMAACSLSHRKRALGANTHIP